jgi:hypothetical protein
VAFALKNCGVCMNASNVDGNEIEIITQFDYRNRKETN